MPSDPTSSATCSKDTHLWAEGARVALLKEVDWLNQILLSGISTGEWRGGQQQEMEVPQNSVPSVASQKQHVSQRDTDQSQGKWNRISHGRSRRLGKKATALPPLPEVPVSGAPSFARLASGSWFTVVQLGQVSPWPLSNSPLDCLRLALSLRKGEVKHRPVTCSSQMKCTPGLITSSLIFLCLRPFPGESSSFQTPHLHLHMTSLPLVTSDVTREPA